LLFDSRVGRAYLSLAAQFNSRRGARDNLDGLPKKGRAP